MVQDELSEEGRVAVVAALAAWLPRCESLPASATARITQGLKEKEMRRPFLRALAQVCFWS